MTKRLLALALCVFASAPVYAQADDIETRALRDEMQRSMKLLQIPSMERPYYIDYKIVDKQSVTAHAHLGSLVEAAQTQTRLLTVTVRVGSYQFDNSSNGGADLDKILSLLTSAASGSNTLPLDDNYDELRRRIWIATDSAYKKALEDLSAKKTAQGTKDISKRTADFSQEPARQESEILPLVDEDLPSAEHLVRVSSAVFRNDPSMQSSTAECEIDNITEHFVNSEGTSYIRQVPEIYFHLTATLHSNGENFHDVYSAHARSLKDFPSEAEILASAKQVADQLTARSQAKPFKRYNGPVLFEGKSANGLFAHNLANNFPIRPHSALQGTIGGSVLPDFLSVVDNPLLTQSDGQPLFGSYKFDEEGIPAQETLLIEAGFFEGVAGFLPACAQYSAQHRQHAAAGCAAQQLDRQRLEVFDQRRAASANARYRRDTRTRLWSDHPATLRQICHRSCVSLSGWPRRGCARCADT